MNSPPIGNISNLINKSPSKPKPKPSSRIELLEGRVATLESALQTVLSELTALRESVDLLKTATATPPKENTATPTENSAKVDAKPPATETETKPPPPAKVSKRTPKRSPWDDPDIRKELEACRPQILRLLRAEKEITKQGCADTLGIDASLAGRTLSYMMTQTNEVRMISPPKNPEDPDPKKRFRRIT